jgi:hypothetical protein
VQNVRETSAVIMWETATAASSSVEYGLTAALGSTEFDPTPVTIHEMTLSDLASGTTYHYRVASEEVSAEHTFTTVDPSATLVRLCAYGDSRNNPTVHQTLAGLMASREPHFLLHAGDLVQYGDWAPDWDDYVFGPLSDVIDSVPFYPCIGNHEIPIDNYLSLFSLPDDAGTEEWYSFDHAGVHVATLSVNASWETGTPQHTWLVNDLTNAQDSDWIIVMIHYPAFSSYRVGHTVSLQTHLVPLFESQGVDLVIHGHDHMYERSEKDGVVYVITGGGGAPLYSPNQVPNPYQVVALSTHHFCLVEITRVAIGPGQHEHTLSFAAYDDTDTLIDQFTLSHITVPAELTAFGFD